MNTKRIIPVALKAAFGRNVAPNVEREPPWREGADLAEHHGCTLAPNGTLRSGRIWLVTSSV